MPQTALVSMLRIKFPGLLSAQRGRRLHLPVPRRTLAAVSSVSVGAVGSAARSRQELSWSELYFASKLARWSGLCYLPNDELKLRVQAEGLQLVAHGRTSYTSWFVADGHVDSGPFLSTAVAQWGAMNPAVQQQDLRQAVAEGAVETGKRRRFVFIRGVQWGAPDANGSAMSSALMNWWPSAFVPAPLPGAPVQSSPASSSDSKDKGAPHTKGSAAKASSWEPGALVSHTGITALAADLFKQLAPWLTGRASSPGQPVDVITVPAHGGEIVSSSNGQAHKHGSAHGHGHGRGEKHGQAQPGEVPPLAFAGHSLGGALGLLVMASTLLNNQARSATLHQFGSPPVLAHRDGGGGHRAMKTLGLAEDAVHSFVLEHDPIPRALLSVDPAFGYMKQYNPVRQLLQARGWLLSGAGLTDLLTGALQASPLGTFFGGPEPSTQSNSTSNTTSNATSNNTRNISNNSSKRNNSDSRQGDGGEQGFWGQQLVSSWLGNLVGSQQPSQPESVQGQPGKAPSSGGQTAGRSKGSSGASGGTGNAQQVGTIIPMLSLDRFVFETAGSVYLLRGGAEVLPVNGMADVEELLRMAVADIVAQPARALQAWLDHHHSSYAHDLETAALAALKQELRSQQEQQLTRQQLEKEPQQQQVTKPTTSQTQLPDQAHTPQQPWTTHRQLHHWSGSPRHAHAAMDELAVSRTAQDRSGKRDTHQHPRVKQDAL